MSPAAEPNITLNWVTRTLFGDWTATNITATGTISANQFIGDGSQLTSIPASSVTGLGTAALMETNKFLGTNIVVNESSSPSSATVDATGKATFNIRTNAPSPTTMVWQPTFNRAISSAATGAGGPLRTSKNYGGFQAQPQGTGASGAVAGVTNGTFKFKHWATGNMTAIRLVYGNSCGNSKNTNAITVQSTVELASGTLIPVFFNGQRSATIQGGAFVTSDPLGITMLKGTNIFSRTYVEVTTTNQGFPLWLYPVNDASHSGEGYSFATNIVDAVSAKYVYASFLEGYGPTVIQGLAPSTNAAIAIFGDSIAVGAGNLDNYGNNSYVESGLSNPAGDRKFNGDWFNHANLAEGSASFDTDTYDVQAFKWRGSEGCNIALVEHGVNNISVGDSFSTITNKMIQFWNSQVAVGRKVFQLTIPPRTTGTYTTVNGQTPWDAAKEGVRTNLNIWLLTQPAPLSGVFDVTTNCTATNASGQLVWRANYTLDGVHPSYLSISWSNMGNSIIQSQFK